MVAEKSSMEEVLVKAIIGRRFRDENNREYTVIEHHPHSKRLLVYYEDRDNGGTAYLFYINCLEHKLVEATGTVPLEVRQASSEIAQEAYERTNLNAALRTPAQRRVETLGEKCDGELDNDRTDDGTFLYLDGMGREM